MLRIDLKTRLPATAGTVESGQYARALEDSGVELLGFRGSGESH